MKTGFSTTTHDIIMAFQICPKGDSNKHKSTNVHSSQNLETAQVTSAEWINKVWIVQNGTLFSLGKEWASLSGAIHRWFLKHCSARHKPGRKQTLHNPTYLRYLGTDSTESRTVATRAEKGMHSWYWKGQFLLGKKPCTSTYVITEICFKMVNGNVYTVCILPQ